MAMSPDAIQTMANHTAFLCLCAELAKSGLIDLNRLADSIYDIGEGHSKAEPKYGGLIKEMANNVRSLAKNAPTPQP